MANARQESKSQCLSLQYRPENRIVLSEEIGLSDATCIQFCSKLLSPNMLFMAQRQEQPAWVERGKAHTCLFVEPLVELPHQHDITNLHGAVKCCSSRHLFPAALLSLYALAPLKRPPSIIVTWGSRIEALSLCLLLGRSNKQVRCTGFFIPASRPHQDPTQTILQVSK